jgi:hypothetical protein
MIVNFRASEISRSARNLARTPTLKKKSLARNNQSIGFLVFIMVVYIKTFGMHSNSFRASERVFSFLIFSGKIIYLSLNYHICSN